MTDKPRNGGEWTEARFNSFIKGALRSASNKWPPKFAVKKAAWVERGKYLCAGYETEPHICTAKEAHVDHIEPVIDPAVGFVSWDVVIERLFCEADNLQVLCDDCHKAKTRDERKVRKTTGVHASKTD